MKIKSIFIAAALIGVAAPTFPLGGKSGNGAGFGGGDIGDNPNF